MLTNKRLAKGVFRPPTRDRTTMCTHLQISRLFDEFGCDMCSVCYRRPSLGWLYRCTQDFNGFLAASDFYGTRDGKEPERDAQLDTLSPSVIDAAQRGHYTEDELNVLWNQKVEVKRTIQQLRPTTASTASTHSSSQYSLYASSSGSTIQSSNSDTDRETNISQLSDLLLSCQTPLQPIEEAHDDLANEGHIMPFDQPVLPAPCDYKVCQTCRPVYKERAWHSLDGVLLSPIKLPPKHEMDNRRVSDVRLVRTLGLASHIQSHSDNSQDKDNGQRNSRTGFQETVQRLLENRNSEEEPQSDVSHHVQTGKKLAALAAPAVCQTASTAANDETFPQLHQSSTDNNSNLGYSRPLYSRRGFERITKILPPARSTASLSGSTGSSPALSTSKSNVSSPANLGLKIDTVKANGFTGNLEISPVPLKTPTESLKDSMKRFGLVGKYSTRFVID